MATLQIVYWRDIPAQIIVKAGRRTEKRVLPERFEQAIDRCAMRVGARDSDAYLAEWRRGAAKPLESLLDGGLAGGGAVDGGAAGGGAAGDLAAAADAAAATLIARYDDAAIRRLIDNDGRADPAG